ncbi:MAG: hypothetical protein RLY86_2069 [Pseudomonadota bacterium]|jgi:hypothetical protein
MAKAMPSVTAPPTVREVAGPALAGGTMRKAGRVAPTGLRRSFRYRNEPWRGYSAAAFSPARPRSTYCRMPPCL